MPPSLKQGRAYDYSNTVSPKKTYIFRGTVPATQEKDLKLVMSRRMISSQEDP